MAAGDATIRAVVEHLILVTVAVVVVITVWQRRTRQISIVLRELTIRGCRRRRIVRSFNKLKKTRTKKNRVDMATQRTGKKNDANPPKIKLLKIL